MKQPDMKNGMGEKSGKKGDVLDISPATAKISKYTPIPPPHKKPVNSLKYLMQDRNSGR